MFLGVWTTNFSITALDKNSRNRVKNADLYQKPVMKSGYGMPQRFEYNFLLKRKLAIDFYIKL